MSAPSSRLTRPHSDASYEEAVVRKSNLLLEARLLQAQGRDDEASTRFAGVARTEGELAEYCSKLGYNHMAQVHRYGAAGCWALAGNVFEALAVCNALLDDLDLSAPLREHVTQYSRTLRARRRLYYSALEQETAADA